MEYEVRKALHRMQSKEAAVKKQKTYKPGEAMKELEALLPKLPRDTAKAITLLLTVMGG